MRETDLMIGDWVYCTFSDKPCLIVGMEEYPSKYCMVKVDKVVGAKDIASLTPIPLTEEILIANGWSEEYTDKCASHHFPEDKNYLIEINVAEYVDGNEIWWTINCNEYSILRFEYVHELQHALRLCGIKKEITL